MSIYHSPGTVPSSLYKAVEELCRETKLEQNNLGISTTDLASIFLGVNAIEVFLNMFFRVVAGEDKYTHAKDRLLSDLDNKRFPLHQKMTFWPKCAFGVSPRPTDNRLIRVNEFIKIRNELMHFKSPHSTFQIDENTSITGLTSITAYSECTLHGGLHALETIRGAVTLIGECRGVIDMNGHLFRWLGICAPPG